VKTQAEDVNQG